MMMLLSLLIVGVQEGMYIARIVLDSLLTEDPKFKMFHGCSLLRSAVNMTHVFR